MKKVIFFVLVFASVASSVWAAPMITTRYVYYDINGSTKEELRAEMKRKGPQQHADAYTEWNVRWDYQTGPVNGGCGLTGYSVRMEIIYHMPRWAGADRSPLGTEWRKFYKALQTHEDGHAQNGIDAAYAMDKALASVVAYPDCRQTKAKAVAAAQNAMYIYKRRDVEYDGKTQHGIKQGAIF